LGQVEHRKPVAIGCGAFKACSIKAQVHPGKHLLGLIATAGEESGPQAPDQGIGIETD
jgi:hypothetical protein